MLIFSGQLSDFQIANQMGHRHAEYTRRVYAHLFAQDAARIREAMNLAITQLYAEEGTEELEQAE